ncbi:hypothetical protein Csa_023172 [Cucumis sativus]|uniref:Uncharacterized protein n=1 Tax=Cucumis sativus TaxID=3659 RepID=A0A0A0LXW7_CUCSA|nr:hypothetical protein Csa_023172 [Cucumis sativus]
MMTHPTMVVYAQMKRVEFQQVDMLITDHIHFDHIVSQTSRVHCDHSKMHILVSSPKSHNAFPSYNGDINEIPCDQDEMVGSFA